MIRILFRRMFYLGLIGALVAGILILVSHRSVVNAASEAVFDSVEAVPARKAAVVMGCARDLPGGRTNLYFIRRIAAAKELYDAGKCEFIIVTGDNSEEDYDEPTDMRDALIAEGVPENKIYRDFAGFRTLDSVVRAKEIFDQTDFIVVSQKFHNERAIYIGKKRGCDDVIGFNAPEVSGRSALRTTLREYLARVKTVLDVTVLNTAPKFLGRPVELGGPVT